MRPWIPSLLLVAVALMPGAGAQVYDNSVTIVMSPPSAALVPGGAAVVTPLVLEAGCGPVTLVPPGAWVVLSIEELPSWAVASVSSSSRAFDARECGVGNRFRWEVELSLASMLNAPAFQPEAVELRGVVSWPDGSSSTATSVVPAMASFVGRVSAETGIRSLPAEHGQGVLFPIAMTNQGNGPTKISFEVAGHDAGLRAAAPPPVVLYAGAEGSRAVVVFQAARMMQSTDAPLDVVLKFSSAYALDSALSGNAGEIRFTLLPPGSSAPEIAALDAPETVKQLPLPGFAVFLVVVGAVSACLGRRV